MFWAIFLGKNNWPSIFSTLFLSTNNRGAIFPALFLSTNNWGAIFPTLFWKTSNNRPFGCPYTMYRSCLLYATLHPSPSHFEKGEDRPHIIHVYHCIVGLHSNVWQHLSQLSIKYLHDHPHNCTCPCESFKLAHCPPSVVMFTHHKYKTPSLLLSW